MSQTNFCPVQLLQQMSGSSEVPLLILEQQHVGFQENLILVLGERGPQPPCRGLCPVLVVSPGWEHPLSFQASITCIHVVLCQPLSLTFRVKKQGAILHETIAPSGGAESKPFVRGFGLPILAKSL